MNIYQIAKSHIKGYLLNKQIKKNGNIHVSSSTLLLNGTTFSLYNTKSGRVCIKIGSNSVLNNSFITESKIGYIQIGERVFIGGGTKIISYDKIIIGNNVLISWGCTICDHDSHSLDWEKRKSDVLDTYKGYKKGDPLFYKDWSHVKKEPIKIEDNVWIGFDTAILKGVTIGKGAVVAAKSVVTKDVPPYTLVAGSPARIIKPLS